jgi:hypothetical protein
MYVQIDLDGPAGTLRVSGHGLPTVELVRAPGGQASWSRMPERAMR